MHVAILYTGLPMAECRKRLASTATAWPNSGTVTLKTMLAVGQPHRVIIKQSDDCFVLALEKYGAKLPFYRGIGFKLMCNLSEEIQKSGTRVSCRMNTYLFWRVLACSVFILFAAYSSFAGSGSFKPGLWIIVLAAVFIGILMPSFLEDGADLISFLKKTHNASEVRL
ncbi:MAG: hypothetical protein JXA73_11880 [Acidobacteria bacterium]|nr:hypothetical protein [Acidobacteriota bacterium]